MYNLIVATLSGCLFYFQNAFAFLHHSARINSTLGSFGNRYGLSGKRSLINSCFPFQNNTVHRDDASCAHNDCISRPHLRHWNQYFSLRRTKPNPINIE